MEKRRDRTGHTHPLLALTSFACCLLAPGSFFEVIGEFDIGEIGDNWLKVHSFFQFSSQLDTQIDLGETEVNWLKVHCSVEARQTHKLGYYKLDPKLFAC